MLRPGALRLFAPRMHAFYESTLASLCSKHPHLRPNFESNVFAAATFNLGPRTATYRHRDHLNIPWGWCSIIALGDFDYTEGGHLVLWDLQMLIEFPPGATIQIPSAILAHSNTSISAGEPRYSMTQYTAGGIVRWMDCGCRSQKEMEQAGESLPLSPEERWRRGVSMLSTCEELGLMPDDTWIIACTNGTTAFTKQMSKSARVRAWSVLFDDLMARGESHKDKETYGPHCNSLGARRYIDEGAYGTQVRVLDVKLVQSVSFVSKQARGPMAGIASCHRQNPIPSSDIVPPLCLTVNCASGLRAMSTRRLGLQRGELGRPAGEGRAHRGFDRGCLPSRAPTH